MMRTQTEVENLLRHFRREAGGDPADIVQITPNDGGWDNALTYTVARNDGKKARIFRKDLDDKNAQNIMAALRGFR